MGKPHPIHRQHILTTLNVPPQHILFVGDTLHTDIRLAEESDFQSALVLSGNTRRDALKTYVIEPTHILGSIQDLPKLFA